jgi:hypothetical protein
MTQQAVMKPGRCTEANTPSSPFSPRAARPSGIRVLAKSLHLLAACWLVCVCWLWAAQIRLQLRRFDAPPEAYAASTLIEGAIPAMAIEATAIVLARLIRRVAGPAGPMEPGAADSRREWRHAFWWTVVPNLLLLGTAYLMILEAN